jgi:sugar phosphate isomerase/epimerase
MKDMTAAADRRDAPAGDGVLPWPAIVEAARRAGVEWYVVEQDEPAEPIQDSARALRFLRSLTTGDRGAQSS